MNYLKKERKNNMRSNSQKLYYSYGEETEVKVRFCNSGLEDKWDRLFLKPIKWIIKKTIFSTEEMDAVLEEYKLEKVIKDGVFIHKKVVQNWLEILENSLIEYPFKMKKVFLDKYFKNDAEYLTFYGFLSYLNSIEEKKTSNGYIKLIIKE